MAVRSTVAALLLTACTFIAPSSVSSYELLERVWRETPIPYCVNPSGIPQGPDGRLLIAHERFVDMVRAAFQKWEDLPRSNVSFTYNGVCDGDPSGSREGRRDGLNTIGWADLRISTGAQTALRSSPEKTLRDGQYREILEADIAINISSFSTLTDPVQFVWTTLPHVLVHEIGHLIGLDHSKVECSVMWPTGFRSEFCRDDLDAMAILYP